jgi:uncharacterized protein YjbI with pentapeptide repeats
MWAPMDRPTPTQSVRPRARRQGRPGSQPILVEESVGELVASGARGLVHLGGPAGSGKTVALRLLAERFSGQRATFLDDPAAEALQVDADGLQVYAARSPVARSHLLQLALAPWGEDEVLELLLRAAPERCGELYAPLIADPFAPALEGLPELWSAVVDACLAGQRPDVARALQSRLHRTLGSGARRRLVRAAAFSAVMRDTDRAARLWRDLAVRHAPAPGDRLARHAAAQLLLSAEHLSLPLRAGRVPDHLVDRLPPELLARAGARCARSSRARKVLERQAESVPSARATAASLLHAGDPSWLAGFLRAGRRETFELALGHFPGARLAGVRAGYVRFSSASLRESDWSGADLLELCAIRADLARASFHGACIGRFDARGADLDQADLSRLCCEQAFFAGSRLTRAQARAAELPAATFTQADLAGADFTGARLQASSLAGADLTGADFTAARLGRACMQGASVAGLCLARADLAGATLRGLDLRTADLLGANLAGADLSRGNLEGLVLPQAKLEGAFLIKAYLTGSRLRGADLCNARLTEAGLAEVDWEGADLREADFTRASFHLGSSRSGLLAGYPSQGTRTGFYTDARVDLGHRRPEDVRKANLCHTNLLGADVWAADFYLVDLRGAHYSSEQERHFRATGAILGAP